MRITVIGTGYVGLVTATCFAESGNDVIGMDVNAHKIEILEAGRLPIYEPGLQELVQRNRREGRLNFTTDLARATEPRPRFIFHRGWNSASGRRRCGSHQPLGPG